jgi:hypothetical protein
MKAPKRKPLLKEGICDESESGAWMCCTCDVDRAVCVLHDAGAAERFRTALALQRAPSNPLTVALPECVQ